MKRKFDAPAAVWPAQRRESVLKVDGLCSWQQEGLLDISSYECDEVEAIGCGVDSQACRSEVIDVGGKRPL